VIGCVRRSPSVASISSNASPLIADTSNNNHDSKQEKNQIKSFTTNKEGQQQASTEMLDVVYQGKLLARAVRSAPTSDSANGNATVHIYMQEQRSVRPQQQNDENDDLHNGQTFQCFAPDDPRVRLQLSALIKTYHRTVS
jgi:hypothetical protein